ncbi:MAG: hypothetical protein FWF72_02835 [Paludibacter sp.]|nr:hypothetical protein [Paludibacter sp.]
MKLHFFNPGHEAAVSNGSPFYFAPANVRLMQRELAFLPAWYAQSNDFVLVGNDFDFSFFENLKNNFQNLPQPISFDQNYILNLHNKKTSFEHLEAALWGISPAAINFFEKIKTENEIDLQIGQWKNEFTALCSRQTANECLIFLKKKIPQIAVAVPQFVNSMQTLENVINNYKGMLIAKNPFSSSGRGVLRIDAKNFSRASAQIIHGWLRRQGSVCIEPMYNKILDFAMEFHCQENENVDFVGYSLFQTDKKCAYNGNILDSQKNIEKIICQYIDIELLEKIKIEIRFFLKEKYIKYSGFIGVDMLIYISENQCFIYPCVEINMRANMGIVAINFVEKYLFTGKKGRFTINFCKNEGEIFAKHLQMTKQFTPRFVEGKLREGYLPLCPINASSKYWAYVVVD